MKFLTPLLLSLFLLASLNGCALAAGAAGGAVIADEANEDDGEFDPLEDTYDGK